MSGEHRLDEFRGTPDDDGHYLLRPGARIDQSGRQPTSSLLDLAIREVTSGTGERQMGRVLLRQLGEAVVHTRLPGWHPRDVYPVH